MKKVIVVVTYEAYIPEDMMVDQLSQNIEEVVRDRFDDFRATAENYHNEEESEPLFEISDVMVGTESMISVGGN
ncbi:hypothetical protein BBD31_01670 [Elizabethkingia anophelis]|uniref:hypothetical protein n=1 Tax=Elizabethkingia anophelis TaxID=1117645 RepID=UPI000994F51A|nr:hypothetical protein [Elizabethkingia anophelis]AQW96683.1 hypothetical protein BBD31_01670 [Elizabethkingia anophelis]MDV3673678.1 hypothetical protein [Elizabethkingia anophelis]MDV3692402.1 hypothetical protein [Elizabethkingia anophelis]OPB50067.1 hypothetical protein BAY04_06830 [Elizabethkingia anophelis]SPW16830.1 Uncharacterised protein [Elizabethkingia anophelis]